MQREEVYSKLLDETLIKIDLEAGMPVYYIHKKGYSKKYAYFVTKYGALYNAFIDKETNEKFEMPFGIAHFLEHKIFESSDRNIFAEFSKLGASVNAYTNFQATAYMFSTVDCFYESLALLLDFVQKPFITEENVEKEKGIIEQEIKMYDDEADWVSYFNLLKSLYHKNPVRFDIAGTVESIQDIDQELLMSCYNKFYTPNNMMVFVIGDLEEDKIIETIEGALTEEFKARKTTVEIVLPEEEPTIVQSFVEAEMDVAMPEFSLGFKDNDISGSSREKFKKSVAIKIALDMIFGKGSEFYNENYKSGLINQTFAFEHSYDANFSFTLIGGETEQYELAAEKVKSELQRFKEQGLDPAAFERTKRKAIGRYLSSYNSIQYVANTFISYYLKENNLFDYLEILKEMEVTDVNAIIISHFNNDLTALSLIKKGQVE